MEGICVNVDYPVHFFQFLKGHCHGNQFCVVADSFARSQSISGSAGPIFTIFARHCSIELQMINPTLFFQYLEGRCHGNQFSSKMGQNYLPPALIALPFRNGMRYHNHNKRVNSVNDVSMLCENFMKFGPVTPELTLLICERQL